MTTEERIALIRNLIALVEAKHPDAPQWESVLMNMTIALDELATRVRNLEAGQFVIGDLFSLPFADELGEYVSSHPEATWMDLVDKFNVTEQGAMKLLAQFRTPGEPGDG